MSDFEMWRKELKLTEDERKAFKKGLFVKVFFFSIATYAVLKRSEDYIVDAIIIAIIFIFFIFGEVVAIRVRTHNQ